jgi:hypothetical protein
MRTFFPIGFGSILTVSAVLLGFSPAEATISDNPSTISDSSYSIDPTTDPLGTPGASDLLYNATAIDSAGNFQEESSAGLSALTDGTFGCATGGSNTGVSNEGISNYYSAMGGSPGGSYATYSLGSNVLGYTLDDIEVYSGWNDSGRYQQGYTLSYALANDPDPSDPTFYTLYTVTPYPTDAYSTGDTQNGAMTELTSSNGVLMSGVSEIKISFDQSTVNGYEGYREFVVDGSATAAPEPSTWALMLAGIGAISILTRGRFQRQA